MGLLVYLIVSYGSKVTLLKHYPVRVGQHDEDDDDDDVVAVVVVDDDDEFRPHHHHRHFSSALCSISARCRAVRITVKGRHDIYDVVSVSGPHVAYYIYVLATESTEAPPET